MLHCALKCRFASSASWCSSIRSSRVSIRSGLPSSARATASASVSATSVVLRSAAPIVPHATASANAAPAALRITVAGRRKNKKKVRLGAATHPRVERRSAAHESNLRNNTPGHRPVLHRRPARLPVLPYGQSIPTVQTISLSSTAYA